MARKVSTKAGDDPWVSYLADTQLESAVEQLKKSPEMRKSLRERIEAAMAAMEAGDESVSSEVIGLMELALAEADYSAGKDSLLGDLKPMRFKEAFSMDEEETQAEIRKLLSQIDLSDPQYLSQETLFQRVNGAHKRNVERGALKLIP